MDKSESDGQGRGRRVLPPPSLQSQSTISTNFSCPNPPVPSFIHRSATKDSTVISETTTPHMIIPPNPWPTDGYEQFPPAPPPISPIPHISDMERHLSNPTRSEGKTEPEPEMSSNPAPVHTVEATNNPSGGDDEEPSMVSSSTGRYYELDFEQGEPQVQKKHSPERVISDTDPDPTEHNHIRKPDEKVDQAPAEEAEMERHGHVIASQYFRSSEESRGTGAVTPLHESDSFNLWEQGSNQESSRSLQHSTSTAVTGPPLPPSAAALGSLPSHHFAQSRFRSPSEATGMDTYTGYSASVSEGPTHRQTYSDASSMFLGQIGTQLSHHQSSHQSYFGPSGSVSRTPSSESKLPQLSVADKKTVRAPKTDTKPVKIKLQEGRFSLDDGSTRRFVYVPSKYSVSTKDGFDAILQALGMTTPDLVFQVGDCYSVVPNQNASEIRAYYHDLRPRNYEGSPQKWAEREDLKFPHPGRDYFDIMTRHNRVRGILDTIATTSCATTAPSSSVFILNSPHRGNELAEFACAAAQRRGIITLGLFLDEDFTCLDGSEGDKEEASMAEFEQVDMNHLVHRGFSVPWDKYYSKRRQKVPKELFREKDFVTDLQEEPNETMQIHCERSQSEKAFREIYRFNVIRNGLADSCSHLLVFESKSAKDEFYALYTKLYAAGIIVAGSNLWAVDQAFECLQRNSPIFVLKNTGAAANAVAELVSFGERIEDFKRAGAQLSHPKFVDPLAVDNYIANNFPPYDRTTELAMDDNIWDYSRVVAHTFLGSAPHYSEHSNAVFDVGSYVDVNSIQNDVTRVITTISDRAPELGGPSRELQALCKAKKMMDELALAGRRYKHGGMLVQCFIRFLIVLAVAFSVAQGSALDPNEDKQAYEALRFFTIVLPLLSSVLITLEATIRPRLKYGLLLLAEKRIESEMYRFRTRTGIYRRNASSDNTKVSKSRTLFMERCEEIIECCFEADVGTGSLFSMTTNKEDIAGLFGPTKTSNGASPWPREAVKKIVSSRARDDSWSVEKMRITPLQRSKNQPENSSPTNMEEGQANRPAEVSHANMSHMLENLMVSADGYLEKRIVTQLAELHGNSPYLAGVRMYLTLCVIVLTASSSALASFEKAEWIALPLTIAAAMEFAKDYMQLDTRVPTINGAASELIKIWLWWTGLSVAQTRQPSNKDELVDRSERAILAQYEHFAGQVVSALRKRRVQSKPNELDARISPRADSERKRFEEITTERNSLKRATP